jgi:hypothetical protein
VTLDDERTRRRDARELETIAALVLIAPTPEMIREVLALSDAEDGSAVPRRAVIHIAPEQEPVLADR